MHVILTLITIIKTKNYHIQKQRDDLGILPTAKNISTVTIKHFLSAFYSTILGRHFIHQTLILAMLLK